MNIEPGVRLGPYEIVSLLGVGGMGEVYEARDTRLDRRVAVKVVSRHRSTSAEFRERFEREARTISQLSHPNICTLHDVGNQDGIEYLVMEFVPGRTLDAVIKDGPLSLRDALNITRQIAEALTSAHDAGIVHRDIKPPNVILTETHLVKVLDFGLATFAESTAITRPEAAVGTLAYMAPEQLMREGRISPATDVWAIGLTLREMLTGARAFTGSNEIALFKAIITDSPPPIERADVPREVKRLIARALEKDPHDRHKSAREFGEELAAAADKALARDADHAGATRRRSIYAAALVVLSVAGVLGARAYLQERRVQATRQKTLPEIERLIQQDQYLEAFRLAAAAERDLASDPALMSLWSAMSVPVSITTVPDGARVSYRPYGETAAPWQSLGTTPVSDVRLPRGPIRFLIEKDGFEPIAIAQTLTAAFAPKAMSLRASGSLDGEVAVPGDKLPVSISGFNSESLTSVDAFLMDRTEVTNRAFKAFVDAGGYARQELWFSAAGQSRSAFVDATGRPGPSTWANGTFPGDQGEFPVGGVSWYEANAYCEFRGRELPTVFHWARASLAAREITEPLGPSIVPLSNFAGKGPAPVGTYQGIGPYGTYDMAGNLREWTWNAASEGRRWILGGSWHEPDYMFSVPFSLPPGDRSPENGFRCMHTEGGPAPESLQTRIEVTSPDYRDARPVSAETFAVLAKQFAYVPSSVPAPLAARETTPSGSIRERVTLDAGYNKERFDVYVFLPKAGTPPYQAVIYFPALNPFQSRMSSTTFYPADYIVQSGRALVLPVYKGSFERWDETLGLSGEEYFRATRQRLLEWRQDMGRTLDYLGTRGDIDMGRVGYYGRSFGASMPLPLLALEPRLRVAVLHSAGFTYRRLPAEMDAVNYAPRITMPVLMMTGRHDFVFPFETSQEPLFKLLGTPAASKRHIVYDAGHDPLPRSQVIREILNWLDAYLGRP